MIEIIKPGKNIPQINKIKKIKTTCKGCECEFKFDFEDMCNAIPKEFFIESFDHDKYHNYYVFCPNCNTIIWEDNFEIFEEEIDDKNLQTIQNR